MNNKINVPWYKDYRFILPSLIALSSFVFSYVNDKAQDKMWLSLNKPNIVIEKQRFKYWEKINEIELDSRNWGYQPNIIPYTEHFIQTELYVILNTLVLWDKKNSKVLSSNKPIKTIEQAVTTANKLGYDNYEILKYYRFYIEYKNNGGLTAEDVIVNMKYIGINDDLEEVVELGDFPPQAIKTQKGVLKIPYNRNLPDEFKINVRFTYKVLGEFVHNKEFNLAYNSKQNSWMNL